MNLNNFTNHPYSINSIARNTLLSLALSRITSQQICKWRVKMEEKGARLTCCLHEKSQERKFCGPGRLKSLASWTRRAPEQSGMWRVSNGGNVVKRSCRGCNDTNKKCRILDGKTCICISTWARLQTVATGAGSFKSCFHMPNVSC